MSPWQTIAADVLVIGGTLAMTLAVVGVLRIPDSFAKIHAAAKGVVLGALVVLLAAVFTAGVDVVVRCALVGAFLLLTTPVGAHVLARFAHRGGNDPDG